jgi:hypothetical protein
MQIKNRQQLLIIVAVAGIVLFGGDRVVFTPLVKAWNARAALIAKLRQDIATNKTYLGRERSLRERWQGMAERTLTNDTSAADQRVYGAIDSWAQRAGVTINAITPQWKRDSDDYMTYECRIDAAGDIDRLSRFLYQAEREKMALKMESVELSARDKEGKQLSLGLQISGLVLNPPAR